MNMYLHVSVLAIFAFGCSRHTEDKEHDVPVEVHCVHPAADAVEETVLLRGRIAPPPGGDLSVASQVAGRVAQVSVKEGDRIGPGDPLATIEDSPSRDAVRQAEAQLAQAHAAEVNTTLTLERTRALVARGIAAKQELEDALAKAEAAKASTAGAAASVDLARRTLGRVIVRSTFSGTVTRIFRGAGALVDGTPGTPILQIAATSGAEFVADATDRELAAIREGQVVQGTLANTPEPIRGSVRARPSAVDPTTGIGVVRITLEAVPAGIPLGSFGRVTVALGRREGVLTVPLAAVRGAQGDGSEVVVCADGKAEVRPVHTGFRDAKRVELRDGVGAEDHVAIDHVLGLESGTPLREAK